MNWDVPRNFHATNPLGSMIKNTTRWETLTDNLQEPTITNVFSELMSDFISNAEQNTEMTAAAEQLGSSQASPDSTNPVDGTGNTTRNNAWPPLEVTDYNLEEWPNSNKKPPCEASVAEDTASQSSNHATPVAAPRTPSINKNPQGSLALGTSGTRNPFLSGYAREGGPSAAPIEPNDNPSTQMEDNPLRYVFRTPPSLSLDLAPRRTDKSNYSPNSRTSSKTAPDSTVTKITRESQAVRGNFRNSLAQLSQVHSRLSRGNTEHVMRADVIMRDMDDI